MYLNKFECILNVIECIVNVFELDLGEGHNLQINFFSKDFGDQIIKTIFF